MRVEREVKEGKKKEKAGKVEEHNRKSESANKGPKKSFNDCT